MIGCRPEKEAVNKNNAKVSTIIKLGERAGQEEDICDFRLGHMRCPWNLRVQMLNLEVQGEIWAKDRDVMCEEQKHS